MHPARNAAATCCHATSRGYRVHHQPGNQARVHAQKKKAAQTCRELGRFSPSNIRAADGEPEECSPAAFSFRLTFAILPRCVPGQAEEGREENDRGGHRSISEPHLISTMPLPSAGCRGSSGSCPYLARSLPSRCCRCCWGGCWRRHTWASEGRGGREEGKK